MHSASLVTYKTFSGQLKLLLSKLSKVLGLRYFRNPHSMHLNLLKGTMHVSPVFKNAYTISMLIVFQKSQLGLAQPHFKVTQTTMGIWLCHWYKTTASQLIITLIEQTACSTISVIESKLSFIGPVQSRYVFNSSQLSSCICMLCKAQPCMFHVARKL